MIAASLERLAVALLIGTAAIFSAAQMVDPRRIDDWRHKLHPPDR